MCGIYGQVADLPRERLTANADRALELLAHRGPDGDGKEGGRGWIFGHRRLAIFDTSDLGRQPMVGWNRTLIFNGAIYNFQSLRDELEKLGYRFRSRTDSEVILAAYDRWGTDCFGRFNGMWALAIYDDLRREVILSRDRFGIKPLYFSESRGVTFASEPRAVVETLTERPALERRIGEEFLFKGWQDHRPETIFGGVRQFPPGHFAMVPVDAPEMVQIEAFYDLAEATARVSVPNSLPEAIDEVRHLFERSVHLQTQSDVGRCITLSGGIDSSSIAGVMSTQRDARPATFSALFPGTPFDETPYVESVNRLHGLPGNSFKPLYHDFIADFERCQWHQGQPLASMAVAIHYSLMRRIHESGEKVILNGQGADEIGAGYDKFYLPLLREHWVHRPWRIGQTLWGYGRHHRLNHRGAVFRLWTTVAGTGARRPNYAGTYFDRLELPRFDRSADADVRTTSVNLLREVGLPVLLRHEDRNTMAFGLESRVAFLDHRLVEYLLALPADWKIQAGVRKYVLREACRNVLPAKVYNRHDKLGFATPEQSWMEGDVQPYLRAADDAYRQEYLSEAGRDRCHLIMKQRRRGEYKFVFRCWSWMQFVAGQR
ncbi:asparagine synthase (glutamine-hydrolyzing) [Neolewinella litorea]|uniref:asparagine synthase (glutamine-hydrolyzing) n=1 Tax=Neolewinella litorea TaxID=2562452 RepID=A0A4S4NRU6_9BACT|nr:asparagine synthase (glutamine-hydrolyzing) [Neolewinella litorea]THH41131.1 asparagine synthase (glutamine-hydrolyzing) [Neolewinella litorea]